MVGKKKGKKIGGGKILSLSFLLFLYAEIKGIFYYCFIDVAMEIHFGLVQRDGGRREGRDEGGTQSQNLSQA